LSNIIKCILINHSFNYFKRYTRWFWTSKFRHVITLLNRNNLFKRLFSCLLFVQQQQIFFFDHHLFWPKLSFVLFLFLFAKKFKKKKFFFFIYFHFYLLIKIFIISIKYWPLRYIICKNSTWCLFNKCFTILNKKIQEFISRLFFLN